MSAPAGLQGQKSGSLSIRLHFLLLQSSNPPILQSSSNLIAIISFHLVWHGLGWDGRVWSHINNVAKLPASATPNRSGFSVEIAEILILRPCCRH